MTEWYHEQMSGDNTDANPFANPSLRLTPDREMEAFLAAGGTLVQWIMREKNNVSSR